MSDYLIYLGVWYVFINTIYIPFAVYRDLRFLRRDIERDAILRDRDFWMKQALHFKTSHDLLKEKNENR